MSKEFIEENIIEKEYFEDLNKIKEVKSVELHGSQLDIYGKRIIIVGGGAQVSQVAMGAITEADRHNIRGERISIDTLPLVGERNLAEAIEAVSRLPRVSALVSTPFSYHSEILSPSYFSSHTISTFSGSLLIQSAISSRE